MKIYRADMGTIWHVVLEPESKAEAQLVREMYSVGARVCAGLTRGGQRYSVRLGGRVRERCPTCQEMRRRVALVSDVPRPASEGGGKQDGPVV